MFDIIDFITKYKRANPHCRKADLEAAVCSRFGLKKERSVYRGDSFAFRFSEAQESQFSNTIISLSTLAHYDDRPFIVAVVRPTGVDFLLANTTFLKKISHSSQQLRVDNVRGSFLGHDIMREFDGASNSPANFDQLFALHSEMSWEDNLLRLVEATTAIVPMGKRFEPDHTQVKNILNAPLLASESSGQSEYRAIADRLSNMILSRQDLIVAAARSDNVNLRGNAIEQIITAAGNFHHLSDLSYHLASGATLTVDIKTKLLDRSSSPKLYNIDKTLRLLSTGRDVFSLLLIGIDVESKDVRSRLVSIFDSLIVRCTRIQFHWAGRASRGVTQLTGDIGSVFRDDYAESIDGGAAQTMLAQFIKL